MILNQRTLAAALSAIGCSGLVLGVTTTAHAQQTPPQGTPQRVDKIEVTGSNIKRIEGEGALPVQVITRKDIERSGANSTEQLLQSISVAVQGNSNTVVASVSGLNTAGVSGASLRGLGSQRTLVLINGRRISAGGTLTDSTTVDINSIPLAAVERVEILKDGASAGTAATPSPASSTSSCAATTRPGKRPSIMAIPRGRRVGETGQRIGRLR